MAEQEKMSASEKKKEDWMNSKWRPMMGWMYMVVCFMDFVGFPIMWSLLQSIFHGNVSSQWQPLTLQGAGLFHIAMGAVIGISAYGRTQEKLGGANNGGISLPPNAGTTYVPPGQGSVSVSNQPGMGNSGFGGSNNGGFGSPSAAPAFGAPAGGFGSPTSSFAAAPGQGAVNASNQSNGMGGGFGAAPAGGFGSPTSSFAAAPTPAITTGFGGKKAPPDPVFPEI